MAAIERGKPAIKTIATNPGWALPRFGYMFLYAKNNALSFLFWKTIYLKELTCMVFSVL
jgi:hypothetical protein